LAAAVAPAVLAGGESYLSLIVAFPVGAVVTLTSWALSVNWLLRQLLVVALRTPGSRMRAGTRGPWTDDAA
jgi:hypothetical protein